LTASVSSLNKLLADKGLTTEAELQKYFLDWLEKHKAVSKKQKTNRPLEIFGALYVAYRV